ncbi:hypothetical protein GGR51DRAFT_558326 [Nemania sp. FL0031]|nr:hypothetical protein GGR51DRAFT_558326 [Nemania sp. FL0031]
MENFNPTHPESHSSQLPADAASHQERSEQHELREPLNALASPVFAIGQQLRQLKNGRMANTQPSVAHPYAVAKFIVPGDPRAFKGVLKAVYEDLRDGNKHARIECREANPPYIRIEAPSEEDVLVLLGTAQRLAGAYLSGCSTEAKALLVEPPMIFAGNFQISVDSANATERVRPTVERLSGKPHRSLKLYSDEHKDGFSRNLRDAFEKVSSLYASLIIRVHLGKYYLRTYKKGKFTLQEFENMVKNPRATGEFDTRLAGEMTREELSIEAAMGLIQGANSPCLPIDNQTSTLGHVYPTYVLECWHDNDRYEAAIDISRENSYANESMKCILTRIKKLDLRVIATAGDENLRTSIAVKKYLEKGQVVLRGSRDDFRCYPVVRLPAHEILTNKFKSVAVKSIYKFYWRTTGYVVQFTINRRWKSIRELNRKAEPDTDFDVVVYAGNWDSDSRTQPGGTVAKVWGDDLGGLLRDEDGDALNRVQALVKIILEIRDFFEGSSRQATV